MPQSKEKRAKSPSPLKLLSYYERLSDCSFNNSIDVADKESLWVKEEEIRLRRLFQFEKDMGLSDDCLIAGVDEAGRGPGAGPVTACAVIFQGFCFLPGLNDSKKISEKLREVIFEAISSKALYISMGSASPKEIDRFNILQASLLAMKRAVDNLPIKPSLVLVDGNKEIPHLTCPQKTVIKGDAKVFSIAAASIGAKVTRDREMRNLDRQYPGYSFALHKGYLTAGHLTALQELGPCPAHRQSFKPVREITTQYRQLKML